MPGKKHLLEQAVSALRELRESPSGIRGFFVPGRIEVLGKHTDYAGGRSLLGTCERGFCVVASERSDARIRVVDAVAGARLDLTLDPDQPPAASWGNYAATVARRIARNFPAARAGADIAFASDLPRAAGMSSSSALVVAIFLVLADVNHLESSPEYRREIRTPEELAGYLGCVENGSDFGTLAGDRGVGTFGGSEDHTAMVCCESGKLSLYSFCPVRLERTIPFPDDFVFVIASSGVSAEKTAGALETYNRASNAACKVLELWRFAGGRTGGTLAGAVEAEGGPEQILELLRRSPAGQFSRDLLIDRFRQFYHESFVVIPAAAAALERRDFGTFGSYVDQSQDGAELLLKNQVPETVALANSARILGAAAASAFGAGFGGSVWALVRQEEADEFMTKWERSYREAFPRCQERSCFFQTRPGPPVTRIVPD
jgi:galactokinase